MDFHPRNGNSSCVFLSQTIFAIRNLYSWVANSAWTNQSCEEIFLIAEKLTPNCLKCQGLAVCIVASVARNLSREVTKHEQTTRSKEKGQTLQLHRQNRPIKVGRVASTFAGTLSTWEPYLGDHHTNSRCFTQVFSWLALLYTKPNLKSPTESPQSSRHDSEVSCQRTIQSSAITKKAMGWWIGKNHQNPW